MLTLGINPNSWAVLHLLNADEDFAALPNGGRDAEALPWLNSREKAICLVLNIPDKRDRPDRAPDRRVLVIVFGECRGSDALFVDAYLRNAPRFDTPSVDDPGYDDAYRQRKTFNNVHAVCAAIWRAIRKCYRDRGWTRQCLEAPLGYAD